MTTHNPFMNPVSGTIASPQRKVRRRTGLRPWTLFTVIVIVAFFSLIYSRIALDRSAFVLDTLEEQIAEAQSDHLNLRAEVAELRSPDRIAAEAKALGMVFPREQIRLEVDWEAIPVLDPEDRWAQLKVLLSAQP